MVQVFDCFKAIKRLSYLKKKEPMANLRGDPVLCYSDSRKTELPTTHSSPISTWLSIFLFFSSPAEIKLAENGSETSVCG